MLSRLEKANARRRVGAGALQPREGGQRPGADALPQIQHIVVLMMENHSYDNYLGMLQGRGDGFTLGPDGAPAGCNPSRTGARVPLWTTPRTRQEDGAPTQSWHGSHIQWGDGRCDGFVRSTEELCPGLDASAGMRYWTEAELPFYYGLARTFPLATRWFSSCLGPTFPNRRFLLAGTANGMIDDLFYSMIDYPANGTILDHLSAHGISWANYHQIPRRMVGRRRLAHLVRLRYLRLLGGALAGTFPHLLERLQSKVHVTAGLYPLGLLRSLNHVRPMTEFWTAARAGTLPSVSIVDPDFAVSSEENPQDISAGEALAARVINAVMTGKGWARTLLIWVYDEHGGYYDHVPPPPAPAPDDVPAENAYRRVPLLRLFRHTALGRQIAAADAGPSTYTRLGFRVPAVVVSPYARPGYVTDTVYDHTAILKLIERKWNLPPLTARDAWAADVLETLDLDGPPAFAVPPVLPAPRLRS